MRFILIILFSFSICAKEVPTGFCFPPNISLTTVQRNLEGFILERDRAYVKHLPNNCLELPLDKGRKELFEKFLSSRFPLANVYQKEEAGKVENLDLEGRKSCNLEVIKETTTLKDGSEYGVKYKKGIFKNEVSTQTSNEVSTMKMLSGIPGSISTEKEIINVKCTVTAGQRYILEFSLSGVTGGISNAIDAMPGQKISLGQIVQDLKGSDRNIDINSGVTFQTSTGGKTTNYWLIVR